MPGPHGLGPRPLDPAHGPRPLGAGLTQEQIPGVPVGRGLALPTAEGPARPAQASLPPPSPPSGRRPRPAAGPGVTPAPWGPTPPPPAPAMGCSPTRPIGPGLPPGPGGQAPPPPPPALSQALCLSFVVATGGPWVVSGDQPSLSGCQAVWGRDLPWAPRPLGVLAPRRCPWPPPCPGSPAKVRLGCSPRGSGPLPQPKLPPSGSPCAGPAPVACPPLPAGSASSPGPRAVPPTPAHWR